MVVVTKVPGVLNCKQRGGIGKTIRIVIADHLAKYRARCTTYLYVVQSSFLANYGKHKLAIFLLCTTLLLNTE